MSQMLEQLRAMNLRNVSLTVTKKNRRAFDWYQRLRFKIRKEYGAYVCERQQNYE